MRQVLAVVTGCVPPTAVGVERPFLRPLKWQVPIGLVEAPSAALTLEVIDNIRQRFALQQVLLNHEGERADRSMTGGAIQIIFPVAGERIEITRPEIPVTPLADRTFSPRGNHQKGSIAQPILQRAIRKRVAGFAENYKVLGPRRFVAQVAGQNLLIPSLCSRAMSKQTKNQKNHPK